MMTVKKEKASVITKNEKTPEQEPFHVGEFRAEDAEGLVSMFRAVYGEHYPIQIFYDPKAIIAANREGRYISIVARTDSGKVIGAAHLYRPAPGKSLYEWGVGLVLKEYRNWGINKRLACFLCNEFVPRHPHIAELFGEDVCNHVFMQKSTAAFGLRETAIEVALMPAEAYARENSATGRVATLDVFRCYVSKPHRIFLPPVYEAIMRQIYGRLDDDRDIVLSDGILPGTTTTKAELTIFDFARVARIAVPQLGSDFATCLSVLEEQALAKNVVVFQAAVNLAEPWTGHAVNILRDRGYFFGGALPRWFDTDGLLMQKLLCPPDFDKIVLYSEEAKQLLEFIQKDWERLV